MWRVLGVILALLAGTLWCLPTPSTNTYRPVTDLEEPTGNVKTSQGSSINFENTSPVTLYITEYTDLEEPSGNVNKSQGMINFENTSSVTNYTEDGLFVGLNRTGITDERTLNGSSDQDHVTALAANSHNTTDFHGTSTDNDSSSFEFVEDINTNIVRQQESQNSSEFLELVMDTSVDNETSPDRSNRSLYEWYIQENTTGNMTQEEFLNISQSLRRTNRSAEEVTSEGGASYGRCYNNHPERDAVMLAALGSQTEIQATKTYDHYCTFQKVMDEIHSGGHMDCPNLTEDILQSNLSDFSIPDVSQLNYESVEDDLQEIHRGIISFHSVLSNISALQVDHFCDFLRRANRPCDLSVIEESICSAPNRRMPRWNCQLHQLLKDVLASYNNLEHQHLRLMKKYEVIPIYSYENVEVHPLHCPVSISGYACDRLTDYTLAGLHAAILQSETVEQAFDRLYESLVQSC